MKFSIIIPVYNRPDEIDELLESLAWQSDDNFEVIVVEDGSTVMCDEIVLGYSSRFVVSYVCTPNGGPGKARNRGASFAKGEYIVLLDSDCVVPPDYTVHLEREIESSGADAFGGPDRAADDFTPIQKAINYSMTSFFTTGGIRGGGKELDRFYPRSFNMGIKREVYEALDGFADMRFGEDIDFSIRLYEAGYKVELFKSAWVYHKRRTDWRKFFRQVFNSGIARINLYKKYPRSLKPVHCLPAAFTAGVLLCLILSPICLWSLSPLALYALLVFVDSARCNGLLIGLLSIVASYIQLIGYGLGFLSGVLRRIVLGRGEFSAFKRTFYK